MRNCFGKLRGVSADVVLASSAVAFGFLFLWYAVFEVNHVAYMVAAILAVATPTLYLIFRTKITSPPLKEVAYHKYSLELLFALVFIGAVLCYVFRPFLYERPLWFFIFATLACEVIALKLIYHEPQGKWRQLCLAEIISIGWLLVYSVSLMYPSLIGQDPLFHHYLTLGVLDGIVNWQSMPLFHIIIASFMKLSGTDYRIATMLTIEMVSVVIDTMLIYWIGKRIANARIGLLSALLLSVSNWHVFFAYWTVQNTLALTLLLVAIWSFLEWQATKKTYLALAILAMLLQLITHPLGTVWLGIFWVVAVAVYWWRSQKFPKAIAVMFFAYSVAVLVWWGLYTGHLETFFYFAYLRFSPMQLDMVTAWNVAAKIAQNGGVALVVQAYSEMMSTHPWQLLYGGLGMFMFFCVGVFGSFAMLKNQSINSVLLVVLCMMSLFMGVVPMVFGVAVLEHRWWYMAEAFLSIPAAYCLVQLGKFKAWLVCIGVGVLVFFLIMGLPANRDNGILAKDLCVRYALTGEEIEAAEYALDNYDGKVGMDAYYAVAIGDMYDGQRYRIVDITSPLLNADFGSTGADVLIIRNEVATGPFGFGEGKIYRLDYSVYSKLLEQGFELTFQNDGANIYKKY